MAKTEEEAIDKFLDNITGRDMLKILGNIAVPFGAQEM